MHREESELIMKAVILEQTGPDWRLALTHDRPIPDLGANELLVRVHAAGLNPSDFKTAEFMPSSMNEPPIVLGIDVAGVVEACGNGAKGFSVGDRVCYLGGVGGRNGGFAEYATVDASAVARLPQSIPFHEAAAVPASGYTAYQTVMQKLRPYPGSVCLVHGGAGGVGSFAIQLSKLCNSEVIATCSQDDIPYVMALGADYAIDYRSDDINGRLLEITNGRGVDFVLNSLETERVNEDVDILTFNGALAFLSKGPDFSRIAPFDRCLTFHEIATGAAYWQSDSRAVRNLSIIGNELLGLIADGDIVLPRIRNISLDEVFATLKGMEAGSIKGKTVAILND